MLLQLAKRGERLQELAASGLAFSGRRCTFPQLVGWPDNGLKSRRLGMHPGDGCGIESTEVPRSTTLFATEVAHVNDFLQAVAVARIRPIPPKSGGRLRPKDPPGKQRAQTIAHLTTKLAVRCLRQYAAALRPKALGHKAWGSFLLDG